MKRSNPKIIFFGTPRFAAIILQSLIAKKYSIAAVFTQPDKKIGRRQEVFFSPVKKLAVENGIKVFQPEKLGNTEVQRDILKIGADLFVVAAYGKILPKAILEIPEYGAINIHASLLPKHRGASPVQSAILSGEKETGITLMRMNEKMDEGDILVQNKVSINYNETTSELLDKLGKLGAKMITEAIPNWISGKIRGVAQIDSRATYCKPIQRKNGKINWFDSAQEIYRKWRAYHPWPGIYSLYGKKRLKLIEIETIAETVTGELPGKVMNYNASVAVQSKKGLILLKKVQLEGKKEMMVEELARGNKNFFGCILK